MAISISQIVAITSSVLSGVAVVVGDLSQAAIFPAHATAVVLAIVAAISTVISTINSVAPLLNPSSSPSDGYNG